MAGGAGIPATSMLATVDGKEYAVVDGKNLVPTRWSMTGGTVRGFIQTLVGR